MRNRHLALRPTRGIRARMRPSNGRYERYHHRKSMRRGDIIMGDLAPSWRARAFQRGVSEGVSLKRAYLGNARTTGGSAPPARKYAAPRNAAGHGRDGSGPKSLSLPLKFNIRRKTADNEHVSSRPSFIVNSLSNRHAAEISPIGSNSRYLSAKPASASWHASRHRSHARRNNS